MIHEFKEVLQNDFLCYIIISTCYVTIVKTLLINHLVHSCFIY